MNTLNSLKLFTKYFLNSCPYIFLFSKNFNKKTSKLLISNKTSYKLFLHIRLSSLTYLNQMIDLFAYELPKKNALKLCLPNSTDLTLVYNVQNLLNNDRLIIFILAANRVTLTKSLVDLFPNTNWLEREVGELFGFLFDGKNDTRNLMLQYGDASAPFKKAFPAIGVKELYYNFCSDLISQTPFFAQA